jgi:hypothetical protein
MKESMRYKVFTVFCLAIMICYVLRPVMPFMEYMINKDYISTHLCIQKSNPDNCCQGKCYLNKLIEKSEQDGKADQNNNRNENQNNTKLDDHIASGEVPPPPVETFITLLQITDFPLIDPFADPIFVPPKS